MRWILLALVLALGIAHSQEPPKAEPAYQKSGTEQRSTEQSPLFIKPPRPTTQAERDHEAYEKHQKPWNETALAYATIALAVITFLLAIFTALLWAATYRLVRDAKKTAERQLRAYVWARPHPQHKTSSIDEIHTTGFKFTFSNDGQTPAYSVRHVMGIGIFSDQSEVEELQFGEKGSRFVLNPGANSDMTIAKSNQISDTDKSAIASGKSRIYVWGEVRYTDAFGQDRWTKFRMMLQGRGLVWCDDGNEAT